MKITETILQEDEKHLKSTAIRIVKWVCENRDTYGGWGEGRSEWIDRNFIADFIPGFIHKNLKDLDNHWYYIDKKEIIFIPVTPDEVPQMNTDIHFKYQKVVWVAFCRE